MFGVLYYLGTCIIYIVSLAMLALMSCRKKYRASIPTRFFLHKNSHKNNSHIWIHACSLGEINSLTPIIRALHDSITISTITHTGFTRAQELFGKEKNIEIRYLPFEIFLPFVMSKKLQKLIVLEAELWYMLFLSAKKMGAKTILLNARISTKSYPAYKKLSWFYKKVFQKIDIALCQSAQDKERLENLGAQNVYVCGNIKALNKPIANKNLPKYNGICIVGASTHEGEEELILQSFVAAFAGCLQNLQDSQKPYLIIAPRHPERFGAVWKLMQQYPLRSARYSEVGLDYNYDVLLLDTLGELINMYSISNVVILGGSFVSVGGHNPLECAHFGVKLISGKHVFNQLALFEAIDCVRFVESSELPHTLENLHEIEYSRVRPINLRSIMQYIQ